MGNEGDESTLIARAAKGDADAFTDLFERYYAMIYGFAFRLCSDRPEAQEIAQETFIKAARALGEVRGSFKGWLYRIARNTATDRLRGQARNQRLVETIAQQKSATPERPPDFTAVQAALASLPEPLLAALVLTFYENMSHAEAAAVLGCAETTVSWRIFTAKRRLRKILSRDE